jgi:UDP-N-acetylmuramate--alanine ligase
VSDQPWRGRRLHLVGVGGAGMSGYARAAAALGASVSGSDRADSPFAAALAADGVMEVAIGHDAANLPDGDDLEVVRSSAIPADNPELTAAAQRGLMILGRAELLAELTRLRRTIAVAGAHGKTTTASMIVAALNGAGVAPSYLIGGTIGPHARNADWREGEWLVVEADESDRSMLALDVEIAVLTSVELDHHSAFGSLLELEADYRRFLAGAPEAVILDRPELLALREGPLVAYDVPEVQLDAGGSRFDFHGLQVRLIVPGAHNALNASAALSVCELVGAELRSAADALAAFTGAGRRFELVGTSPGGAVIYDDYAHHPTEIAVTLAAARTLGAARLVAVFQPHLFSRTVQLAAEFGAALAGADAAAVLDIYPARERAADFPGVTGKLIAGATVDAAPGKLVYWLPTLDDGALVLSEALGEGDLAVFMGAGDVDTLARRLVA